MNARFSHIEHWVFDLDHTLYSPELRLFDQIELLMTLYVQDALDISLEEADHLRKHF